MASTTQFIIDLSLLLASAVVAGEVANRLGQAALVGQLLVGVLLGPTLLGPYIGLSSLGPELVAIQTLGTVFILFLAGLDIVPEQIYRMGAPNAIMGVLIFAVPFAGMATAIHFLYPGTPFVSALFLALTLSITALPVMGIMLIEFGLTKSALGRLVMNCALVNELVAVSVFAVLLQVQTGSSNGFTAILIASISVGLFIAAMLAIHMGLRTLRETNWWAGTQERIQAGLRTRESGFAVLMVIVLGASLFSQYLGLTFVVGAFYAGLLVTRESAGLKAHRSISLVFDTVTWGFFIPLFFAFVGIEMNLRLLASPLNVLLLVLLLATALLTKVVTGYGMARALKWSEPNALAVGYLVSSRGAVELAMAVTLLTLHVFTVVQFTIVAAVGLVTTILSPIGALRAWEADPSTREELYTRVPSLRPGRGRTRAITPEFDYTIGDPRFAMRTWLDPDGNGAESPPAPAPSESAKAAPSGRPPLPAQRAGKRGPPGKP
ncbi:MAG: cation:proton antiporter [Thermoplasmata archaeon]|nr:cation:proton antiporter [Thermoplasmata archaeon]